MLEILRGVLTVVFLVLLCAAAVMFIMKTRAAQRSRFCEDDIYELAFKDDLTGLFNRNAYIRYVRELEVTKRGQIWILLFDIDDFKEINDTKGHLEGDRILIAAAGLLKDVFCIHDHRVYRMGGDEFAVVARNATEEQVVALLLRLGNMEKEIEGFRFSKGYARVDRGSEGAFKKAFYDADKLLYADKSSKKVHK